jgi:hypothetical protein
MTSSSRSRKLVWDITEEENGLEDFLGVNITKPPERGYHLLTQPQLIKQILTDLNLQGEDVKIRDTPALSTMVLSEFPESEKYDQHFHYRSVIRKLNYLEKSTCVSCTPCSVLRDSSTVHHGTSMYWW